MQRLEHFLSVVLGPSAAVNDVLYFSISHCDLKTSFLLNNKNKYCMVTIYFTQNTVKSKLKINSTVWKYFFFIFCVLTPLVSTVLSYFMASFYWWRRLEFPKKTTDVQYENWLVTIKGLLYEYKWKVYLVDEHVYYTHRFHAITLQLFIIIICAVGRNSWEATIRLFMQIWLNLIYLK